MRYGIYAMRDDKVGFLAPAIDASDASAMRSFGDAISDPDGLPGLHPADFSLYRIGEYDTDSGHVFGLDAPSYLCSGSDFRPNRGDAE